ncbi:MAG: hypothetical protein V4556_11380 [Bacteroidota bacterium]
MKSSKNGTSAVQQNLLAIAMVGFSVYIVSLLALALVVAIAPDSKLSSIVDSIF